MAALDPRVILTVFTSGKVLEELYSYCFLNTLFSLVEGMPIALLEAMSHGYFCLTSDSSENGKFWAIDILFQARYVVSLKEALGNALTDGLREAFAASAREKSELSGWDWVVDHALTLYGAGATEPHPANGGVHLG